MRILKKCSYLILFLAAGIVYLSCVDEWQVYAEPLSRFKEWYSSSGLENMLVANAGSGQQNNVHPGDIQQGDMQQNDEWQGDMQPGADTAGDDGMVGRADSLDDPGEDAAAMGGLDGMNYRGDETYGTGESGNFGAAIPDVFLGTGILPEDGEEGEIPGNGIATEIEGEWPLYMDVEDDYFSDAVFIGDSRTVGLCDYGGLQEIATFYASKGLTIYKMFDAEIASVPNSKNKVSVEDALQQNSFGKIYLMIGINEMGTGTVETFMAKYQESVEHLQELQPDAIIYLQGIIKVTTKRSNQGDYINNEGIEARNEAIAQLADNEKIFYLDVNPLICDETGGMEAEYTGDGVHLKAKYIEIWKEYLKAHAIAFE